jgi:hypothetical protein
VTRNTKIYFYTLIFSTSLWFDKKTAKMFNGTHLRFAKHWKKNIELGN